MEPCLSTPDLFHGRTRAETAALHPPPLRYNRTVVARAIVPPYYEHYADGTGDKLTLRRIEYGENPLSLTVAPEDPATIVEVWEILDRDPDRCQGVIFKRRHPVTKKVYWSGYDGVCEQRDERRSHLIWDIAVNSQRGGLSSTGWRKQRWPNPPPY